LNPLHRATTFAMLSFLAALFAVPPGIARAGTLATLYTFPKGIIPQTGLVAGPGGALYGATNKTVYQLVQDAAGRWQQKTIFGTGAFTIVGSATALYAATNTDNSVYELAPPAKGKTAWTGSILHVFRGGKDGSQPLGLTLAPDGSLYGTTQLGGGASACGSNNGVPTGCGTFFRLVAVNGRWSEQLIHAFTGGVDGAAPVASPSIDTAGNVYLTTSAGGVPAKSSDFAPRDIANGCGLLVARENLKVNGREEEVLEEYNLCIQFVLKYYFYPESKPLLTVDAVEQDQTAPMMLPTTASLEQALIFTTTGGGDQSKFCLETSFDGCGTVAELIRTSSTTKPWDARFLHVFTGSDGFSPTGDLTPDGAGRIFGVAGSAVGNCPFQGCGEIFALVESAKGVWEFGIVYRFTTDVYPVPQLTLYKGKLLGTTSGYSIPGTIYEVTL